MFGTLGTIKKTRSFDSFKHLNNGMYKLLKKSNASKMQPFYT